MFIQDSKREDSNFLELSKFVNFYINLTACITKNGGYYIKENINWRKVYAMNKWKRV